MTKKQIEVLKMLGYEDTQEEGAILQHNVLWGNISGYVWQDDKFDLVVSGFAGLLEDSLRRRISYQIREGGS
jgi:hypothetical protein